MDLPTLNSILSEYDLTSNRQSKQFSLLYKSLTINNIVKMFESYFEYHLLEKLRTLGEKDKSCLSRELVTVVLDESVFKQWLSSFNLGENYSLCFGSFFSGQTRSTVYGFKNGCIGIVIDGIYYPLYFDYVKKRKKTDDDKYSATVETALDLINRFGKFKERFEKEGIKLGKLHFSADNGFSDNNLINCAAKNGLIYIGIPKKSHLFEIQGTKIKLKEWIETVFYH